MELRRCCPYCHDWFDIVVDIAVVKGSKTEQGPPVIWKGKESDKELLLEEELTPTVRRETTTDGKP